jgi:uncharacterized phage protein (TIGR02218 family)
MRDVPPSLAAHLAEGATTLCHAWRLTRQDGVTFGFTDHDRDIAFDGVTYRAHTGFVASEAQSRFDLSGAGGDVAGILADASLTEAELAAGIYDAAAIETSLVDWQDVDARLLTFSGTIGEIRREGQAFVAELRGLADALAQECGRLFTASCSADLGDVRCKVDLTAPGLHGSGSVAELTGVSSFIVDGLDAFDDGAFNAGRLTWTSGANAGHAIEIKQYRNDSGFARLTLWQAMAGPCAEGDAFTITSGCDKRFSTCRDRFANGINFRGFPHIPGNDFVMSYPAPGEPGHTGASLQPTKA